MIKTAIFGTGFMGRVHLEACRRLGSVDAYTVSRREKDYREVLADPAIGAVHICTPNAQHFEMAKAALEAGKHVLCEKPLTVSVEEAAELVALAAKTGLRNCLCHNLRYYPMVQHMRRLREAGELGEMLVVQGTYSQDWLLYDTDWNWRIEREAGGPLRAMADIGTHWFDMAEHVTGLRVEWLCADLQTYHSMRKKPRGSVETFAVEHVRPEDHDDVAVTTDDFGSVIFRMGDRARGAMTASQVSAGNKNRLAIEVYGTKASAAWNQERPDELWMGNRNTPNQILIKDPSLLQPGAQSYADLPGGHSEGYDDTFKQVFRRFYASIADRTAAPEYPPFVDGLRQMKILQAVMESHQSRSWREVA